MNKKVISIILAISIIFSTFSIQAFAAEVITDKPTQTVYTILDKVVNALVGGIAAMIKTPDWGTKDKYNKDLIYPGLNKSDYKKNSTKNDSWQVGYANASLLTGKEIGSDGDYYVGGSLSVTKKLATEQWDDQKVRTIAISDGRGITIFAVLDAYGIANTEVNKIRERINNYAKENGLNITSFNISVLHQHSCVDTFGLNGDILNALFTSSIRNIFKAKLPSGINEDYQNHLYDTVIDTAIKAVNNMESGKIYYGKVNVKEYIRDKRDPQVFDEYLHRFRFVPDNTESKETWITNGSIHCVGNGASHTELTGDYPYYMEQYINKNDNANFFYIQGAELAISNQYASLELDEEKVQSEGSKYEIKVYGETLAKKLETIKEEKEVAPIFNISFKQYWINIDNNILVLAAKGGLLNDNICRSGFGKYSIITEIGYAEFGNDIILSIIPGELAPEIVYGSAESSETSWQGKEWEYDSFAELSPDKEVIVFGLTNDQVGYLLTSNNWHSYFTENEEIVSCGQYAGAETVSAYTELVKEFNS